MRKGLLTVVALCALVCAPAADATFPGANGKIAYDRWPAPGPSKEVWTVNPDGTDDHKVTVGSDPAWSPNGAKLAFVHDGIWTINPDGTGLQRVTPIGAGAHPAWSPDGQQIVFAESGGLRIVNADGTGEHAIGVCGGTEPDWGADGRIVFSSGCLEPPGTYMMLPDGSDLQRLGAGLGGLSWSPGQVWVSGHAQRPPGTDVIDMLPVSPTGPPTQIGVGVGAAWSPDGSFIAYTRTPAATGGVFIFDTAGNFVRRVTPNSILRDVAWQPLPPPPPPGPGYARPQGATPFWASLVPTYVPCESPNRTHGPPLAFGSCNPPHQTSSTLTVGTPDANGQPARSFGRLRATVQSGDVSVDFKLTDVRCRITTTGCEGGPLSDYAGSVDVTTEVHITDRFNGGSGVQSATTMHRTDLLPAFRVRAPCTPTPAPDEGATCSALTTLNAITPGSLRVGKRAIWDLGPIQVIDPGPDGDPALWEDNEIFATQGVFVP